VVVLAVVGLIFFSQLPFLIVHLALLWRPGSPGPVTFCFGDPHANMLVGLLLPPAAGACAYVRRSRALARMRPSALPPRDPNA
jgi:hypothetical protein